MNKLLILFSCFISCVGFSQGDFFIQNTDTLEYTSRTGGDEIDSLPDYHAGSIFLNPGGYLYSPFGNFHTNYTNFLDRTASPFIRSKKETFIYSGIPHVGFMYSFGSKGIQMLHVDYQQFFSKKMGINFSMNKSALGEMIRNGNYRNTDLHFSLKYMGSYYKNLTNINFQTTEISQNGGLDTTASVLLFPLEFLPINKANAHSDLKNFLLNSEHYIDFAKDSLKEFGFLLSQQWSINNRVYTENGSDLSLIYNKINIDTFETRDQFQFAKINNTGGLYLKSSDFFAHTSLNYAYWDYQNLSRHQDTVEVAVTSSLIKKYSFLTLKNEFYYNLIGAKGQKEDRLTIEIEQEKLFFSLSAVYQEKLPDLFQRSYFANNYNWTSIPLSLQKSWAVVSDFQLKKGKQSLQINVNFRNYTNHYFFIDSVWRNDTLNQLYLLNINLKGDLRFKTLIFQPYLIFNQFSPNLAYLPSFDFRARIAFNKAFFEAKKLNFLIGIDGGVQSSRKLMSYNNALDIFVFSNQATYSKANALKLDFFTGFQIEEFRFYIKAENIQYIWNKSNTFNFSRIPLTPFYFRIGLTWDFFN